jgi:hypothetical protein
MAICLATAVGAAPAAHRSRQLAVHPLRTAVSIVPGPMVEWTQDKAGPGARYAGGGLVLTAGVQPGDRFPRPTLTVVSPDGGRITAAGVEGSEVAAMWFGIGRLDPATPVTQVLMTSYTGGAHCCVDYKLIEYLDGAWRVTNLGPWDGDPPDRFPVDVDGDGVADLVKVDNRFLYAFDSYAFSWAPPQVINVVHGRVVDVSAKPRYGPLFAKDMRKAQAECAKDHANGACAGFVADAARLGRTPQAWRFMLANYDRKSDWILPTACAVPVPAGRDCPARQTVKFATFPQALRWFLGDTGYLPPVDPTKPLP